MLKRIRRSGDAAIVDGSPSRGGCGEGCQESHELFNPCIVNMNSTPARSSPSGNRVTPQSADRAADNIDTADESFSIVDWISQSLPCVGSGAAQLVSVSRDQEGQLELHMNIASQRQNRQHQSTRQFAPSDSHSWCDLSTVTPCPIAFNQQDHDDDDDSDRLDNQVTARQTDLTKLSNSAQQTSHPTATASNSASNHRASSWLSGHLGLIPNPTTSNSSSHVNVQQQQQVVALAKPPSLIKTASLTKPPSFTKTSSFTQATTASTSVSSFNHHNSYRQHPPPRSKSPSSLTTANNNNNPSHRRTPSQTILQSIQHQLITIKNLPPSRSNSRSNTPVPSFECCRDADLYTTANNDGVGVDDSYRGLQNDSNSSVGLNSMQQQQQQQQEKGSNNGGSHCKNKCNNTTTASCAVVEPLGFTCDSGGGNSHSLDTTSDYHHHNEQQQGLLTTADSMDRAQSGSCVTIDTGGTSNHTNTFHTILTKGQNNQRHVVDNIHMVEKKEYITMPRISNSSKLEDNSSILDSSMSSSLPSQQVVIQQPSLLHRNKMMILRSSNNKRSPSPLFGTQKVHLEKFLSRNNNNGNTAKNNNGSASECGTITTDGASGLLLDAPAASTVTSKRKVQWGSGHKMPVLITANDHSTEVTNRESSRKGGGKKASAAVDTIRPFAAYHEEIVTALIESALKGDCGESSLSLEEQHDKKNIASSSSVVVGNEPTPPSESGVTSSPKRPSISSPIRKIRRSSPHRASLSTPLWKRNRSSLKLEHLGKMKLERRMSDHDEKGLFHFKKNPAAAATTTSSRLEKQPLDYFHPQCRLMKEKGSEKRRGTDGKLASAVGKDAVLEKLQEKLSMLGDIESGKYGKAAEMLQSDAVAFSIQNNSDPADKSKQRRGHVRSGSHGSSTAFSRTDSYTIQESANDTTTSSAAGLSEKKKAVVETRSLLTLRMGFVSISYGILLQWDIESRLVELIVLRKMCREDFLERSNEDIDSSTAATTKSTKPSTVSAESSASGTTLESNTSRSQEPGGRTGLSLFPQLLSEPDQRPKSFLSVSVVNVKHIHTGCDLCIDSTVSSEKKGAKSQDKRVIRPYIRFVLGKNEHCTKPAKLLPNGHLYYYKRHNNSCLLPMPKEEFRWFAGQEDLIVEVRDNVQSAATKISGKAHRKNKYALGGKHATKSNNDEQSSSTDPILAVVTVPLSSVNIEDEDHKMSPSDGEESVSLSPWKGRKSKKHEYGRDETTSTNITLPLRMVGCSSTSFGSISLQITVKVPRQSYPAPPSSQQVTSTSEPNGIAQESIEIGAIARIMQGWAIYDSGGATDDENTKASKSRRRKIRKPQLMWNKKWNPKTKRWSQLKLSSHGSSRDSSSEQASWLTFLNLRNDEK